MLSPVQSAVEVSEVYSVFGLWEFQALQNYWRARLSASGKCHLYRFISLRLACCCSKERFVSSIFLDVPP